MSRLEEIADGVYRLGTDWVNFYLCDSDGALTVIDCGFRDYYEQLPDALDRLGRPLEAIAAVVLTHYHSDHVGSAERIRSDAGATVFAPAGDAEGVRKGKAPPPGGLITSVWRPAMLRYLAHAVRNGGASMVGVGEVEPYDDGAVLDVPVKLRAIHTPGHTAGHCSLLAEDRGVLFTGDALRSFDFLTGQEALGIVPFNEDTGRAKESLGQLEPLAAEVLAFGHGAPFRGTPAEAVARAS